MNKKLALVWAILVLMLFSLRHIYFASDRDMVPNQFVVRFEDGSYETRALPSGPTLMSFSSLTLDEAMAIASSEPGVVKTENVYYLTRFAFEPNDVLPQDRWRFDATDQTNIWASLFSRYVSGNMGEDLIIAILDDGIQGLHPDLNVTTGYDFANGDSDPSPTGSHGNHVAGISGAIGNNGIATTGVFPGIKLMPLKVFTDAGVGQTNYLAAAIDYAVQNGAHVINMSLGYGVYSQQVEDALTRAHNAGLLIVAASGNASALYPNNSPYRERAVDSAVSPAIMRFPGAHPTVFAVGAAQWANNHVAISDYSSIGGSFLDSVNEQIFTGSIDVIAPGSRIVSSFYDPLDPSSLTTVKSGTSMASPHVAGIMALMKATYPTLPAEALYAAVRNTASQNVHLPNLSGISNTTLMGNGLVQLKEALYYYLPPTLVLEGKIGDDITQIPLSFDPLQNTYTLTLVAPYESVRLVAGANNRISGLTLNGQPLIGGVSDWVSVGAESLVLTLVSTSNTTPAHLESYVMTLTPLAALDNADLKRIIFAESDFIITPDLLAIPEKRFYVSDVTENLTLQVETDEPLSTVKINGVLGKQRSLSLNLGDNPIVIQITSPNESNTKTYSFTLVRDPVAPLALVFFDAENSPILTTDALVIDGQRQHLVYPENAVSVNFSWPTRDDIVPYAFDTNVPLPLTFSQTRHTLTLRRSNQTEKVVVLDSPAPFTATLQALSTSHGLLTPAFSPATFDYAFNVSSGHSSVMVSAIPADARFLIAINGETTQEKTIALITGANTVTVRTFIDPQDYPEANDATTTSLQITREAPPPPPPSGGTAPPPPPPSGGSAPPPAGATAPPANTSVTPSESTAEETTYALTLLASGAVEERVLVSESDFLKALGKTIEIGPMDPSAQSQRVVLSKELLALLDDDSPSITLGFQNMTIEIPSRILSEASETFELIVEPDPDGKRRRPEDRAEVFALSARSDGRRLTRFSTPLVLTFDFDESGLNSPDQAGVFYAKAFSNQWAYVGGIRTSEGKIQFKASHFSQYTVKAYEADFKDIGNHWAKASIEVIASRNLTRGTSENEFSPNATLTHAQFIVFLNRLLNLADNNTPAPFDDVPEKAWYKGDIQKAYAGGLLDGIYGQSLNPDAPIPRDVMAGLLMNAFAISREIDKGTLLLKEVIVFGDEASIDPRFNRDVRLAAQLGLIKGTPDGLFNPKQFTTRAEAMTVLYRLILLQ